MTSTSQSRPADPLLEEESLLDTVLEAVPALVVVLDTEGRIVRFNRACESLTGYAEAEVAGRPVWDVLIPPESLTAVRAVFGALVENGTPSTFRNDWVGRDGRRHPIAWSNSVRTDGAGRVACVVGTGLDLTRQLETEAMAEALRASEARYAGIVSIAADAILSIDADQRIILFNEGAEEIFGWSRDEILGRPLDVLLPGRFRSQHRERHVPAFAASDVPARRMAERREIFGLRRSGEEFPAEASISQLTVGGERMFTVVLRDVTARRRLEAAQRFLVETGLVLSSSLDYATTLRDVAQLAVRHLADFCIIDIIGADGGIDRLEATHRDPTRADLARRFRELPLDRSAPHLASVALAARQSQLVRDVTPELLAGIAQSDEHLALLRQLDIASFMAVPLAAHDRLLGALVLVSSSRVQDTDDLEVAEELARRAALAIDNARLYREAQRAVHTRDEVVSIVAHDLGNPISAIRVGTSLLLRALADDGAASAREHLAAIRTSTQQMERLITDLLDLRRIESNRLVLDRRPYAPAEILDGLRPAFGLLATEFGIALDMQVDAAAPPRVEGDPDRIRQVLENLLGNAFKFTRSGGTVTVRVGGTATDVVYTVRDTGRGIEPDQLAHLFDRFWQATRSGRRSVGLGLSIAKGIIDAHGGRIDVESEPGRGTTFTITLPLTPPGAAEASIRLST